VPLKVLLGPYPVDAMICWPVSPRVGNVKNNDASLIDPVTAAVITPAPCRVEHDEAVDARHLAARLRRSNRGNDQVVNHLSDVLEPLNRTPQRCALPRRTQLRRHGLLIGRFPHLVR
jgi:hypothetical protein